MDMYVGETARPLRERAIEHERNKINWNPQSYQIAHWMEHHYNDAECPEFQFEIISQYTDPLRRQLSEALYILKPGTLNKKMEFNSNEICRLLPSKNSWDLEKEMITDSRERGLFKKRIAEFISTKSGKGGQLNKCDAIAENLLKPVPNRKCNSRYLKNLPKPQPRKRIKLLMDCSTPINVARRREEPNSPDDSPISAQNDRSGSHVAEFISGPSELVPTGLSDNTNLLELTPKHPETSSRENRDLFLTSRCWSDAARHVGMIKKALSLPNVNVSLGENAFFKPYGRSDMLNKSVDNIFMDHVVNPWSPEKVEQIKQSLFGGCGATRSEGSYKKKISPIRLDVLDEKQRNLPATPGGTGTKRVLKISPSTPTAGHLKVAIVDEASPELKEAPGRSRCLSFTAVERKIKKLHLGGEILGGRTLSESSMMDDNIWGVAGDDKKSNAPTMKDATPAHCTDVKPCKERMKKAPKSRLAAKFQHQVERDIASGTQKKLSEMWKERGNGSK